MEAHARGTCYNPSENVPIQNIGFSRGLSIFQEKPDLMRSSLTIEVKMQIFEASHSKVLGFSPH